MKAVIFSTQTFSKREWRIFLVLLVVFLISTIGLLFLINQLFLVEVPSPGGKITEGVVGTPRFINPLLAISDADRDLTQLVYSGLMRARPDGKLIPDLAKEYSVSEDGLVYTFHLKEDLVWHDGKPITSDDITFTISKVQDDILRSPQRASWEGVLVEKIDNHTIRFTLQKPYSPFLENTTLGILPKHIWEDIPAEQFGFAKFNINPVGSGPYLVDRISNASSGIPQYYDLVPFKDFSLGKPHINQIRMRFFANEKELFEAFSSGSIEATGSVPPSYARDLENKGVRVERYNLPRVFGIFFNQNKNAIFTNRLVRQALDIALPKKKIVEEVLLGYGTEIDGPLPPGVLGYVPLQKKRQENENKENRGEKNDAIEQASAMLENAGWEMEEEEEVLTKDGERLAFSIATPNTDELKRTAEIAQAAWKKLGAEVIIRVFSASDLNKSIIRPREYQALLFGEIIGRATDPFAFWHSSQRNDPGLNIALYTNITVDNLLEKGRETFEKKEREKIYQEFAQEIKNDVPAIFIYAPDFLYALPEKVGGVKTGVIGTPSERFLNVHQWFIETKNVWKFLAPSGISDK